MAQIEIDGAESILAATALRTRAKQLDDLAMAGTEDEPAFLRRHRMNFAFEADLLRRVAERMDPTAHHPDCTCLTPEERAR